MCSRVLPCLSACLCRDWAPVIFPCSYRRGENPPTPTSSSLTTSLSLTLISHGEGWWQAIHSVVSCEHTCVGVRLPQPSFFLLPSFIPLLPLQSWLLLCCCLFSQLFHSLPCLLFIFGPYRGSLSAPALFVLLVLSSHHPAQTKPNNSVNEGATQANPTQSLPDLSCPKRPPQAHFCWRKRTGVKLVQELKMLLVKVELIRGKW